MQTKTTSKILSMLLAVCLVLGMMPMTAFAATYSGNCGPTSNPSGATWTFDDATSGDE